MICRIDESTTNISNYKHILVNKMIEMEQKLVDAVCGLCFPRHSNPPIVGLAGNLLPGEVVSEAPLRQAGPPQ